MPEMPEQHAPSAPELKPCPFCGSTNHPYHKEGCFLINTLYGGEEAYNTRPLEDALLTRAEAAEARVAQLERAISESPLEADRLRGAIDEALAIIAGGNPDLPAEVLAEVEFRLQEAYVHHSRNVPDK